MKTILQKILKIPIFYKKVENVFLRSRWAILFCLACYLIYEQGLKKLDQDFAKLHTYYQDLLNEKKNALNLNETLHMEINSQSDPDWVELVLMKGLGLVPEGHTKVLFTDERDEAHP